MRYKNKRFHPIKGIPNYFINRNGFVYSANSRGILKPQKNAKHYLRVGIWLNGRRTWHFIHRLVAMTFKKNPHRKEQVNHLDFDIENNAAKNLAWVTDLENKIHSRENKSFGVSAPRARLSHEEAKRLAGTPF